MVTKQNTMEIQYKTRNELQTVKIFYESGQAETITQSELDFRKKQYEESYNNLGCITAKHKQKDFATGKYVVYPVDQKGVAHPDYICIASVLDRIYLDSCAEATHALVLVWKNKLGLQSKEIVRKKVDHIKHISSYSPTLASHNDKEVAELFNKHNWILEQADFRIKELRDTPQEVFISYGVAKPWEYDILNGTLTEFRISKEEMGLENVLQTQTNKRAPVEGEKPLQLEGRIM